MKISRGIFVLGLLILLYGLTGWVADRDPLTEERYDEMGHLTPYVIMIGSIPVFAFGGFIAYLERKKPPAS